MKLNLLLEARLPKPHPTANWRKLGHTERTADGKGAINVHFNPFYDPKSGVNFMNLTYKYTGTPSPFELFNLLTSLAMYHIDLMPDSAVTVHINAKDNKQLQRMFNGLKGEHPRMGFEMYIDLPPGEISGVEVSQLPYTGTTQFLFLDLHAYTIADRNEIVAKAMRPVGKHPLEEALDPFPREFRKMFEVEGVEILKIERSKHWKVHTQYGMFVISGSGSDHRALKNLRGQIRRVKRGQVKLLREGFNEHEIEQFKRDWKKLPKNTRAALMQYGNEGFDDPEDGMGSQPWDHGFISLGNLIRDVWRIQNDDGDSFTNEFKSFDEYHKWYKDNAYANYPWMRETPDSMWPIILGGPPGGPYEFNEVIQDGWHRFHWYVDRYQENKMIPVVWSKLR